MNGGFPEPLVKDIELKEYLSTLFNSIVYKDIVKRYKIRRAKEIEDLAYYLISNVANEYSFYSLTKISKIKSSHTMRKYLSYLEESFILFSLSRFSYKVKEQLSSNKKIYCIDNGFIQAKAFTVSPDLGKLYENVVACALKKEETSGRITVYYWKNQQQEEVDFVIKKGAQVEQLIQVCYNLKNLETKNREIRALIKAGKELRCKNLLMITEDKEGEEKIEWFGDKAVIQFIPLWKWLLDKY
jgi:predicted AAA+ superfamily ATPase